LVALHRDGQVVEQLPDVDPDDAGVALGVVAGESGEGVAGGDEAEPALVELVQHGVAGLAVVLGDGAPCSMDASRVLAVSSHRPVWEWRNDAYGTTHTDNPTSRPAVDAALTTSRRSPGRPARRARHQVRRPGRVASARKSGRKKSPSGRVR